MASGTYGFLPRFCDVGPEFAIDRNILSFVSKMQNCRFQIGMQIVILFAQTRKALHVLTKALETIIMAI